MTKEKNLFFFDMDANYKKNQVKIKNFFSILKYKKIIFFEILSTSEVTLLENFHFNMCFINSNKTVVGLCANDIFQQRFF
jgi:hypothetical protein